MHLRDSARFTPRKNRWCKNQRFLWCPLPESNQRHGDFQSPALPTELNGHMLNWVNGGPSGTWTRDLPVMSRMLWPTELMALKNGRGGRIWTRDPLVPNQLRYQTALHPEAFIFRVSNNILTPFCFPVKIIFSTILFLTFALLKKKSSSFSRSLSIIG